MLQARESNVVDIKPARTLCRHCSFRPVCLPSRLTASEIGQFEKIVTRKYPVLRGQHVYRTGDSFANLLAISAGAFKSYTVDADGREQVLGFYLPGETLGLDGFYSDHHQCGAVALEDSQVCTLPYNELSHVCCKVPDLNMQLLRTMSGQMFNACLLASDRTAEQRLAGFLIDFAERLKLRGASGLEFELSMSRSDIANYLRLATETVSRVFARFRKDELIEVMRRKIRITGYEHLAEIGEYRRLQSTRR